MVILIGNVEKIADEILNSLPENEDALPMAFNCPVCDGYITINSKGEVIA